MTTEPNKMQISCQSVRPAASGRARIECEFAQVWISGPKSAAEIEKSIADEEKGLRDAVAKNPPKFWRDCAETLKKADGETDPEAQQYIQAYKQACSTKDLAPLTKMMADRARQVTAKTCQMSLINTFRETLEQLDANTWSGTDGPRGLCNVTVITSLWAESGQSGYRFWNFKQVKTIPETENGPLCKDHPKLKVHEMKWRNPKNEWNLGCQFVTM